VAGKYEPLSEFLRLIPASEEAALDLKALDRMVGGLPPNAASASWWTNTAGHAQARAWMLLGRRARVDLRAGRVVFSPAGIHIAPRTPPVMDGVKVLDAFVRRAGYPSVAAAVAEHTVFLDPRTVAQTAGKPVFPIIRDPVRRGQFGVLPEGRRVLLDDNTTPTWAFLWAAGCNKGVDVQYNHVWTDSQNPELYTALWNLCATPAFLAKTTDGQNHPEVRLAVQFRAYELYGAQLAGRSTPARPDGYEGLSWAPMPEPIAGLEAAYRSRLASSPKSRMAVAAREIGWLFSGWAPDATLGPWTVVVDGSPSDSPPPL